MQNIYIGYHFQVEPKELGSEILIAELGEKAFETFTETDNGISAYVHKDLWEENILDSNNKSSHISSITVPQLCHTLILRRA